MVSLACMYAVTVMDCDECASLGPSTVHSLPDTLQLSVSRFARRLHRHAGCIALQTSVYAYAYVYMYVYACVYVCMCTDARARVLSSTSSPTEPYTFMHITHLTYGVHTYMHTALTATQRSAPGCIRQREARKSQGLISICIYMQCTPFAC
jgi:hypothetical protein